MAVRLLWSPLGHIRRGVLRRFLSSHSEAQIAQLTASMKEWGWTNPVLADEAGGVIAGRARILAARQLGIAEVPVMVARGWTDAQNRKARCRSAGR